MTMSDSLTTLNRLVAKAVSAAKNNAVQKAESDIGAAILLYELSVFEAHAELLRTKLRLEGITPLVILPQTIWSSLCEHAELFPFDVLLDTKEKKKKLIARKVVRDVREKPKGTGNGILDNIILIGLMLVLCGGFYGVTLIPIPAIKATCAIVISFLFFILPGGIMELIEKRRIRKIIQTEKDSVVYITEGCLGAAVAIITQWGDFPIKEEMIAEIVDSAFSI